MGKEMGYTQVTHQQTTPLHISQFPKVPLIISETTNPTLPRVTGIRKGQIGKDNHMDANTRYTNTLYIQQGKNRKKGYRVKQDSLYSTNKNGIENNDTIS